MLDFSQHSDKPSLRLLVLHDDAEREFDYVAGSGEGTGSGAREERLDSSLDSRQHQERLGHGLLSHAGSGHNALALTTLTLVGAIAQLGVVHLLERVDLVDRIDGVDPVHRVGRIDCLVGFAARDLRCRCCRSARSSRAGRSAPVQSRWLDRLVADQGNDREVAGPSAVQTVTSGRERQALPRGRLHVSGDRSDGRPRSSRPGGGWVSVGVDDGGPP